MTPPTTQSQRQTGKRKALPPKQEPEVISLSSDSGPIVISSDTTHISISSNTSSRSPIVISDSSSANKLKPINASIPQSKATKPMKPATRAKATPPSIAKTTVRRRPEAATKADPSSKAARSRKRKCSWDVDSSSEDSKGEIFVPKPSLMKPSLTNAPVPRRPPTSPKVSASSSPLPIVAPAPSSPLSSLLSLGSKSSKRPRVEASEPPVDASGNEADVEELVPSSQSDEQELTLPKDTRKDPAIVIESVDKWRRESSVVVSLGHGGLSLPPEEPPASSPLTSPMALGWPVELPSPISAAQTDADGDVNMADYTAPYVHEPSVAVTAPNAPPSPDSEGEVIQQLHRLGSVSTLSSTHYSRPPTATIPSRIAPPPTKPRTPEFRPLTPPSEESLPQVHPTPRRLTVKEKTDLMLERLKAEAAAAHVSSDEEPASFAELDSDSDDENPLLGVLRKGKGSV